MCIAINLTCIQSILLFEHSNIYLGFMHLDNNSLNDYLTMRYQQAVNTLEQAQNTFIELEPFKDQLTNDQKDMYESMSTGLRNANSEIRN